MTTRVSPGPLFENQRPVPGGPVTGQPVRGRPDDPRRVHREGSSLAPWTVVAVWAVLLGILAAVGAAMGNNLVVLEISGGAAVLVLAIAGAVWLDHRLRPNRGVYSLPVRLGGTFLFAVTALTAWLALAFGQYMLYLAAVPLAGAVGLEIAARRGARAAAARAGAVPAASAGAGRG